MKSLNGRRAFIKLGFAFTALVMFPLRMLGFENTTEELVSICTGYRVPHNHELRIPKSALQSPPIEGITVVTSPAHWLKWWGAVALRHTHEIHVSQKQLIDLSQGLEVILTDSAQVHQFVFRA